MSTAVKVSHLELIAEARAARDAGIAMAEEADRDGWDRKVISQAISAFAGTGRIFTANDIRPLLPEVRSALIGGQFIAAARRGQIRVCGQDPSTKKNTHGKPVARWIIANRTGDTQ